MTAPTRRRRRRRLLLVFGVLLLLASPFLVAAGWWWWQVDPPGEPGAKVAVVVEPGWGVGNIADELSSRGVIDSAFAFRTWVRLTGAGPFRAGRYTVRENMGAQAAADALARAPELRYTELALPPGLTLPEIAEIVDDLPRLSGAKFLELARSNTIRSKFEPPEVTSLEGLTWPDTYFVSQDDDEASVLRTLVRTFDSRATKLGLPAGAADVASSYRTIIIASLIQSEAKLDEDRPLIAAVVDNRLRDDMPLQIDATVIYARGTRDGGLTDADFERDSPYNTYKVKGLPPTPISTVAAVSIKAAMRPADVPYKFYVLIDANGKHAFATTFEEHEENIDKARAKGLVG